MVSVEILPSLACILFLDILCTSGRRPGFGMIVVMTF